MVKRGSVCVAVLILCASLAFAGAQKEPVTGRPVTSAKLGAGLIGKLEGPEVVLDRVPTTFKEAPELAALVKAGKLPPVKERIGQDPVVIKPLHSIGKYGGIWRRGFTGPSDWTNGWRAATGPDRLVFWDYTATKLVPNLAKKMEVSPDQKAFTFSLRRGMRWSDGQPFTADDILFWYEDMYLNKELNPTPTIYMSIGGKAGKVEKIDDFTVVFRFPAPYPMFPEILAGTNTFGQSTGGLNGGFHPKHYLKQYHPRYVPKEELARKVAEAKFDNWVNLYRSKSDWSANPELPVLTPWKTVSPRTRAQWVLERNPYSVWVDTAGNQLPYIDKVVMTLAENLELLNLRAAAGEYDSQSRHILLSKLPVLIENQQKGGYRVNLDNAQWGSDVNVFIDMWYDKDPLIGKLLRNVEFRRALSLGINRDQLNETFWLGTGTPGSIAPVDENKYNPGPEYRNRWATYDLAKANQKLDELGLGKKDANGWRLRPDGSGVLRLELMTIAGMFVEYTQMAEMIRTHWEKLGIQVSVKEVDRALGYTMFSNDETQLSLWTGDGGDDFFLWPQSVLPTLFGGFSVWFNSNGAKGKAPDPFLKEMAEIYWKGVGTPAKERIQLGKRFWRLAVDNVIQMGIVGGASQQGIRVTNVNLGNAPERQYCAPWALNPATSRPITFYWKNR